jgi:hypothetical protein
VFHFSLGFTKAPDSSAHFATDVAFLGDLKKRDGGANLSKGSVQKAINPAVMDTTSRNKLNSKAAGQQRLPKPLEAISAAVFQRYFNQLRIYE